MELVRVAILWVVVCGAVTPGVTGQGQTNANSQVSGFMFELLLTHLSAVEDRIQQQLAELGQNQTQQLDRLISNLDRPDNNSRRRYSEVSSEHMQRARNSRCRYMPSCRIEIIENQPDARLNGEWVVLQNRFDGSFGFNRNWREYRDGFGNVLGEHWLGLRNLHLLQMGTRHELLVLLESFENETAYANYNDFRIGHESNKFAIESLGNYSGTAGDSLKFHLGANFSTEDRDNDSHAFNCASIYHGGWWYKDCYASNLNGKYTVDKLFKEDGLIWNSFKGPFGSMKATKMLVREYTGTTSQLRQT